MTTPQGTPQRTLGTINNHRTAKAGEFLTLPQGTPQSVKIDTAAC